MIKNFNELHKLDISRYVSKKPTFRKNKTTGEFEKTGKELDYLNWADCLFLLYQNGAECVKFGNEHGTDGHPLFVSPCGAPSIRVWVEIDEDRRVLDYPVIDGSTDIAMDKLKQSDVHNASQRAFVKCVAINWGLGLSLWQKEEREAEKAPPKDDLSAHSALAVKRRIEELITIKQQGGLDYNDMLSMITDKKGNRLNDKAVRSMLGYIEFSVDFERQLRAL